MELITPTIRTQLLANWNQDKLLDIPPVVKFFTPDAGATWLISAMDQDGDILYGLCDLGLGFPELGYVSLRELQEVRGRFELPVERDVHVTFDKTLGEYYQIALRAGYIFV